MVKLTDCPNEVLDSILRHAASPSLTRETDLCSLSLLCRRLHHATKRWLYREVAFAFPERPLPTDHDFQDQPVRWLTYRRLLLFLRSLEANAQLGSLVSNAYIAVDDQSEMPDKDNMNAVEPSGEQLEYLRKTGKAADIKRLLRMIPMVQVLDVDYENYFARDEDLLVASEIGHSFTRLRQLTFRAPGATLDNSLYLFWIPTLERLDLEDVTLGSNIEAPQLRGPGRQARSTSSLTSLSLGYVPLDDGLSEILSWPAALEEFRYAGRYATAEEFSVGLEPLHHSLKRLDITAFDVEPNDLAAFDFSHCSRLEYLAVPDGLLWGYNVDLESGPGRCLIKGWPPHLQHLFVQYTQRQPFLQHVEGQTLRWPYQREIDALLNFIDLKSIQLPDLRRMVIEHKRHWHGPTISWIPPSNVKQALDVAGLELFNELRLGEGLTVET